MVVAVGYTDRKGLSRASQKVIAGRSELVGHVSGTRRGRPSWRKKKIALNF